MPDTSRTLAAARDGHPPSHGDALALADETGLSSLLGVASELRYRGHRNVISYSRKVFIPLTQLCRDVCHYCTFAKPPRPRQRACPVISARALHPRRQQLMPLRRRPRQPRAGNAQLGAFTERHNAQLWDFTERYNAQLAAMAKRCEAQVASKANVP